VTERRHHLHESTVQRVVWTRNVMSKRTIAAAWIAPPILALLSGLMAYNEYRATLRKEAVVAEAVLIIGELVLGILLSAVVAVSARDSEKAPAVSVVAAWFYVLFLAVPSMS